MLRYSPFISLLCLAACGEPASPPPAAAPQPTPPSSERVAEAGQTATPIELPSIGPKAQTKRKGEIDWARARIDLAANEEGVVSIQSAGEEPASVPVLVPTGIVTSQSAGNGPIFRRTEDGYFAFYPGEAYNIIVNGTNETVEADAMVKTNTDRSPTFTTTVAGAQVWLTRYGADYTVEFECNTLQDEAESCIEEADAMEIANNLVVSGSR